MDRFFIRRSSLSSNRSESIGFRATDEGSDEPVPSGTDNEGVSKKKLDKL